ncbi:MAG: hypothetical protein K0S68_1119 [Candidatus Saccharibacteria bacterium]|nr:hypothetical protein [Candidatus Saccharibacteria bacterium]
MNAAQLSVREARARETRLSPIDRFSNWTFQLGRRQLAARARRVFGRHYGHGSVVVTPERIPGGITLLNHVQITLQGYEGTLVLFATSAESNPGYWLARYHLIMGYCHRCGKEFSDHWVPPVGSAFWI